MVGIVGGRRPSIRSKSGTPITTTAAGTALGSGPSIGTTSTANNVLINKPGPSVNQLSSPSGIHTVASISSNSGGTSISSNSVSSNSGGTSSTTNQKLAIASMLLAMKNQTLGAYSPGGSKAGGSITENYSGVNLG